jgi:hypothetical protein
MEFPEGSWGTGNIEPVADGLVLRSRSINTKAEWGVGHAGLYYHSPLLGTQKLISGVIYALAVNSDGCRLAAFVDPWDRANRQHRLVAMDLCERRS